MTSILGVASRAGSVSPPDSVIEEDFSASDRSTVSSCDDSDKVVSRILYHEPFTMKSEHPQPSVAAGKSKARAAATTTSTTTRPTAQVGSARSTKAKASTSAKGALAAAGAGAGAGAGSSAEPRKRRTAAASKAEPDAGAAPADKKKKKGGTGGLDVEGAGCLHDLGLKAFDMTRDTTPGTMPVIMVQAARGGGLTTLLASLLVQAQEVLGLTAAVVVCDRAAETYMNGVLPRALVVNQEPAKLLTDLLSMQRTLGPGRTPLAFVLDDVLYNTKLLGCEAFIQSIRQAAQFGIMVIIGTSAPCVLPPRLTSSFATHVFASQCYSVEDAKHVHKSMFGAFDDSKVFLQVLSLCRQYEFLVSRVSPSASLLDITRFHVATVYVSDPSLYLTPARAGAPAGRLPDGVVHRVFHVDPTSLGILVGMLSRNAAGK